VGITASSGRGVTVLKPVMLVSRVKLAWGFSVRYAGLSAAQPALPLPPPTTIIGYYAEPLARMLELPEQGGPGNYCSPTELLAKHTIAAAAGLDPDSPAGIVLHSDLTRVLSLVYQRKRKQWENYAWSVQALGAAYGPGATLYLAIVVDAEGLGKDLDEKEEQVVEYLAWSGWRLGSKEGLVAVLEAKASEPLMLQGNEFRSILYQDEELASSVNPGDTRTMLLWGVDRASICGETAKPNYRRYSVPISSLSTPTLILPPKAPVKFHKELPSAMIYCVNDEEGICVAAKR